MPDQPEYALFTLQPGATPEVRGYATAGVSETDLAGAGHLLADGATPEMTFYVVPLEPAQWDSI